MAAGAPEDVPPVAAHEAQAFQALRHRRVTNSQKDNEGAPPEFIERPAPTLRETWTRTALTLADLLGSSVVVTTVAARP